MILFVVVVQIVAGIAVIITALVMLGELKLNGTYQVRFLPMVLMYEKHRRRY
jgi:hypothetical protein